MGATPELSAVDSGAERTDATATDTPSIRQIGRKIRLAPGARAALVAVG